MRSDKSAAITGGWKPSGEPEKILEIRGQADLCQRDVQLDLQAVALPVNRPGQHRGAEDADRQITADKCCDTMIAAITEMQES